MNERIRELEKQSVFYNEEEGIWELDHIKFAELIVRECVMVASNPHLNDEESYYGNEFAKAIKKRFGVEDE